jgi:hypothetical protein
MSISPGSSYNTSSSNSMSSFSSSEFKDGDSFDDIPKTRICLLTKVNAYYTLPINNTALQTNLLNIELQMARLREIEQSKIVAPRHSVDIASIILQISAYRTQISEQAPVRPQVHDFLEQLRSSLQQRLVSDPLNISTRLEITFTTELQQTLCTKQNFAQFISGELPLPMLKSFIEDQDEKLCVEKIKEILKDERSIRALEFEMIQYRDALLSCLKITGAEYDKCNDASRQEKLEFFVKNLASILPCYPSRFINFSCIQGIDEEVDAILKATRPLSSPIPSLQAYFETQGWSTG